MRTHLSRGLATAAPLLAWAAMGVAAQSREGGSQVPCAAPLEWRVARVDAQFGLSERDVERSIEAAAALWEGATGTDLFRHTPDGFPIRLVFDDRQAAAQERAELAADAARASARLDALQASLAERAAAHEAARATHEARQAALERRISEHNAVVRRWNERGDASPAVQAELRSAGAEIEADRAALAASRRALEAELEALRRDESGLNEQVAEHNRRVRQAAPAGEGAVESGVYRESVRLENGRTASVSREIRIYRFASPSELVLVAAHELGHALGLGHVRTAGAVMSEEHRGEQAAAVAATLPAADLEQLGAVCPGLVR